MKLAINLTTKTIIDILPDNATENHKFLVNNGYRLLEIDNPYNEDGSFITLTDEHLKPFLNADIINQIEVLENSINRAYREVLSNNATQEAKDIAQAKIDDIELQIQNLREKMS